jgi:type IV secretion system protein VirB10
MPDNNDEKLGAGTPAISDKRTTPPGVMRKSLQSWVILIVAVLMLLLIWLTGGTKGKTPTPRGQPTSSVPLSAAGTPDEIARRLLAEQREQERNAAPPNPNISTPNPNAAQFPTSNLPASSQASAVPATERQIDPIADDERKRRYMSLFSSSVALSYRELPNKGPQPQSPTAEQMAAVISGLPLSSLPQAQLAGITPMNGAMNGLPPAPSAPVPAAESTHRAPAANANLSTGKTYTIFEGTLLETVLVNRLDGDFNGPVICMTTSDVYSQDRQHLLIPAGSKILGETKRIDSFGQRRLAVSFHRLIMPDGYSLDLDHFQGLSQIGETGLKDKINNHYLQIFGASIAIGAIGGLAQLGTQVNTAGVPESTTDVYRQGVATSLSQSSLHVLDKFLNILPTVTIREGHRVKVFLTEDLLVPDYTQHAMPSNI